LERVPRRARSELGEGAFHVTARGNARMKIFLDETDYRAFIGTLRQVAVEHAWLLHAYCLMPNHFHLVVEARGIDLSRGMRALSGAYAQRFNRRYERSGHVFQGRYDARVVDETRYRDVREYVLENPIRAGLVGESDDYPWRALLIPD
jgi:REP element-mobilizing transposase RayT